jgi:hypothetical protein
MYRATTGPLKRQFTQPHAIVGDVRTDGQRRKRAHEPLMVDRHRDIRAWQSTTRRSPLQNQIAAILNQIAACAPEMETAIGHRTHPVPRLDNEQSWRWRSTVALQHASCPTA